MATYQLPDGRIVSTDMAFTLDGVQYPSNWLALSSAGDRAERGIEGPLPEPAWYDQQFYWGPDLPKDHGQLVEQYSEFVRMNANAILRDTDWMVIREADNGTPIDPAIKTWRQQVRIASGLKITALEATADTPELAAYVAGSEYQQWPVLGEAPEEA